MVNHYLPLTVSVSQSNTLVNVGSSAIFYTTVSGGIAPYTYQWYQGRGIVGTASQLTVNTNNAGTYGYYYKITDSEGTTINSNNLALTVASIIQTTTPSTPSPSASPSQSPTSSPSVSPSSSPTLPSSTSNSSEMALSQQTILIIAAVVAGIIVILILALGLQKKENT
jgi:hypothetical protein